MDQNFQPKKNGSKVSAQKVKWIKSFRRKNKMDQKFHNHPLELKQECLRIGVSRSPFSNNGRKKTFFFT